MNWYCFDQNNSGGDFDVDDKVCHRLFIEAESFDDAVEKAEELGCYWDGVAAGIDCPCCGDRWSLWNDAPIDLDKYSNKGYSVSTYESFNNNAIDEWNKKYSKYEIIEQPIFKKEYGIRTYVGRIRLHNIEEYAQFMADKYGWTTPDARIYYHDGSVKEIFGTQFDR